MFWKTSYEVNILHSDKRVIDVAVKLGSLKFFISFVYGYPARSLQQQVWDKLIDIGSEREEPWFVVDDLNELVNNSEIFGGPAREDAPFCHFVTGCKTVV